MPQRLFYHPDRYVEWAEKHHLKHARCAEIAAEGNLIGIEKLEAHWRRSMMTLLPRVSVLLLFLACLQSFAGTITGSMVTPGSGPVQNGTLAFQLSQNAYQGATGAVVASTAYCYTSIDGSIVGLPNPLGQPTAAALAGGGALAAGIYYIEVTYYNAAGETLASPELQLSLPSGGAIQINSPPMTTNALGYKIYVGTASGAETLQQQNFGFTSFNVTTLAAGTISPASNSVPCTIFFNDALIPSYTYYNVSLLDSMGNAYAGYPEEWYLRGGLAGTVSLANGTPLFKGYVTFPQPLSLQPTANTLQSIAGPLSLTNYNLVDVLAVGVGTHTPAFPIDVQNGSINTVAGLCFSGNCGTAGQILTRTLTSNAWVNPGAALAIYYQTLLANATPVTQRAQANFTNRFKVTDSVSPAQTNLDLNTLGTSQYIATIAAPVGSSTNFAQFDGSGNLAPCTTGCPVVPSYYVLASISFTSCGLIAYGSTDQNCTATQAWPVTLANTTYRTICTPVITGFTTGNNPGGILSNTVGVASQTTTNFNYYVSNFHGAGGQTITINCIATN